MQSSKGIIVSTNTKILREVRLDFLPVNQSATLQKVLRTHLPFAMSNEVVIIQFG